MMGFRDAVHGASLRNGVAGTLALLGLLPDGARAGAMTTTPELRRAAIASCTGDVLRLCPSVMFDEQQVFACMKAARAQLTPNCRAVFDEGAKTVRR